MTPQADCAYGAQRRPFDSQPARVEANGNTNAEPPTRRAES